MTSGQARRVDSEVELDGFDVLVAGAGAAGLAAALSAAQRGASVLLVEARDGFRSGCNTALSTGMVPGAGSRWQRAAAIDDDPQRFLDDVRAKTHGTADPTIAGALTSVSAELVEWLVDRCEVPLSLATDFDYPGHSRQRCHTMPDRSGSSLHTSLLQAASRHEAITLVAPMRLLDVELTGDGDIGAAVVQAPGQERERVPATNIVLGTCGFGARADLVAQHLPEIAGAVYFGADGSMGDALRIGEAIGAELGYLDAYQGHGAVAQPHGVMVTWATVMHGAVLVDRDGARFGDETLGYSEFGPLVAQRPGGSAWVVLDKRIDELCRPFADYRSLVDMGAVIWAESADDLAQRIGAERLAETVRECRAIAGGEHDDKLGRRRWEAPLDEPVGAIRVSGALFHTQGGLLVDGEARVRAQGGSIPHLFAAGGAAAGMSGHGASGYIAGNGLLGALGLGYLAGRSITA